MVLRRRDRRLSLVPLLPVLLMVPLPPPEPAPVPGLRAPYVVPHEDFHPLPGDYVIPEPGPYAMRYVEPQSRPLIDLLPR